MSADLHLHSTFSDGSFSPEELVEEAADLEIDTIAITDHDTVEGVSPALKASEGKGVEVIPAIELSTFREKAEIHILGYFIDLEDKNLLNMTEKIFSARLERARKMVKLLNEEGINITFDQVRQLAGDDYVGRPHIARAMVESGYISDMGEAFTDKYIGNDGKAYVPKYKISPREAIKLIKKAQGLPILAHPHFINHGSPLTKEEIKEMKDYGLVGVEVYHTKHDHKATDQYLQIASDLDLLVTGGTDFHGENSPGTEIGDILLDDNHVQLLKDMWSKYN